jgi:hypothetical protein
MDRAHLPRHLLFKETQDASLNVIGVQLVNRWGVIRDKLHGAKLRPLRNTHR